MKKIKNSTILSAVLVVLILVISGFGIRTLVVRNKPVSVPDSNQRSADGQNNRQGERQRQGSSGNASRGQNRNATAVRITPVATGTIENSVVINGDVLAVNQVAIYPTVAGKISETYFRVGDRVSQGAIAAMVDPSRPGQVYSGSPVISTISGTVLQAPVHTGDTVSTQSAVYVVGDLSSLMVETFVPERFTNAVRYGLNAQVLLEALPGEFFSAFVQEISPVLDPSSRTLRILLRFAGGTDTRIKAGMFATVSLVTNVRQDVPVIPRGAIINTYGSWIVFIVDEKNTVVRREITLGLENEDFVEVLSGLDMGDRVVSAGQNFLSDGDSVRIVE